MGNELSLKKEHDKESRRPRFIWNVIRQEVRKKYGNVSYPYLVILLYHHIIARDNLQAIMRDWTDKSKFDPSKNYLILDKETPQAMFYLQSFKTNRIYPAEFIPLDPQIADLIVELHGERDPKYLFPPGECGQSFRCSILVSPPSRFLDAVIEHKFDNQVDKIGAFIRAFLKKIDLFKDEGINYIRHSIISTALHEILKLPKEQQDRKRLDLAITVFSR